MLSRRDVLKIGAVGLAGSALTYCGLKPENTSFKSLKEKMPTELKELGFNALQFQDKQTEKEMILLFERHKTPLIRDMQSNFIDYVIDEFKADSIGLEGLYGGPNPQLNENVIKDYKTEFKGADKIIEPVHYHDNNFEKYVHQKTIPCYGVEDKGLLFRFLIHEGLFLAVDKINNFKNNGMKVSQIPRIGDIEEYLKIFPRGYLPTKDPEELVSEKYLPYMIGLIKSRIKDMTGIKNKLVANNIEKYTNQVGSKRGIVVMGVAHMTGVEGFGKPSNLTDLIESSKQIVLSPMVNPNQKFY